MYSITSYSQVPAPTGGCVGVQIEIVVVVVIVVVIIVVVIVVVVVIVDHIDDSLKDIEISVTHIAVFKIIRISAEKPSLFGLEQMMQRYMYVKG